MAEGGGRVSSGRTTVLSLRHSPIKIKEIRFSGSKISLKANYIAIGSGSGPDEIDTSVPDPEWDYEIAKRVIRYIPGNRMTGEDVRRVQAALLALGISIGPSGDDSDYGSGTKAGVEEFQRQYGLGVDGKVGPEVREALGLTGPAAYPIGTEITVDAKFTTSNTSITSAKIRAVDGRNGFGGLGSQADPTQPVTVNFSGGESTGGVGNGFYRFKIRRAPTYIKIHNVKWLWRCRDLTGISARGEGNAGTSHHHVYITYSTPVISIESAPHPIQWMRWACKWANNAADINDIAKNVHKSTCTQHPPYFNRSTGYSVGDECTTIWHMMKANSGGAADPYAGSCSAYANLIVHACALLGIAGRVELVVPVLGDPGFTSITGEGFPPDISQSDLDSATEESVTLTNGAPIIVKAYVYTRTHASNQYEGCAVINGIYYGGYVFALGNTITGISSQEELMYNYCYLNGRYPVWYSRTTYKYYGKDILSPTGSPGNSPQEILQNGLKLGRTTNPRHIP